MSVLSELENRLERAMDGMFSRIFRSGVHPVEIGKRIQRVMEDGKTVALRRVFAPNSYRIVLNKKDYERLAALESKIVEELEVFVAEAARQRDWALAGPPQVHFASDPSLGAGAFRVQAKAVQVENSTGTAVPTKSATPQRTNATGPTLVMMDENGVELKRIAIRKTVVIGRSDECELIVPDRTVSRRHAEVGDPSGNRMFVVTDLGSRNGTTVNGRQVNEHRLTEGDRIGIGSCVIEFRRTS